MRIRYCSYTALSETPAPILRDLCVFLGMALDIGRMAAVIAPPPGGRDLKA